MIVVVVVHRRLRVSSNSDHHHSESAIILIVLRLSCPPTYSLALPVLFDQRRSQFFGTDDMAESSNYDYLFKVRNGPFRSSSTCEQWILSAFSSRLC
jgi:hypothetical protein